MPFSKMDEKINKYKQCFGYVTVNIFLEIRRVNKETSIVARKLLALHYDLRKLFQISYIIEYKRITELSIPYCKAHDASYHDPCYQTDRNLGLEKRQEMYSKKAMMVVVAVVVEVSSIEP